MNDEREMTEFEQEVLVRLLLAVVDNFALYTEDWLRGSHRIKRSHQPKKHWIKRSHQPKKHYVDAFCALEVSSRAAPINPSYWEVVLHDAPVRAGLVTCEEAKLLHQALLQHPRWEEIKAEIQEKPND